MALAAAPVASLSVPKKVGLALVSALLVLVAAELYLRWFQPVYFLDPNVPVGEDMPLVHQRSSVPGLTYELKPGVVSQLDGIPVEISSHGMRDDEPLPDDAPGLYRVAVLGDSIGFGWKVAHADCFSEVLERALRAARSDQPTEVLNFSVTGYSTKDEVNLFAARVAAYRPDLLIVAYCMNDPVSGIDQPLPRYFAEKKWYHRSHLFRFVAKRFHERRVRLLGGSDYYRYVHNPKGPEWPTVVAAYGELQRRTAELGIPVLVVIFPWVREPTWEEYPYRALHEQVAREASSHGFQVLDLLPAFSAHPPFDVVFGPKDPHPTALGHRLAGEELARVLLPTLGASDADPGGG